MPFQLLETRREGPVEYLTLNRPDVRNAFNGELIDELRRWADGVAADKSVRVAVIAGAGKVFCAGADLTWMATMASATREENVRDATATAGMFGALDRLPIALVGRVHGAALGGGAGLAAVCDVVIAATDTVFGFTEVKVGIVPSMISPYALAKIGPSAARELFLTGMRFDAARAKEIGLVHAVAAADALDATVDRYVQEFLSAGPEAIATAKDLIRQVAGRPAPDVVALTAETIAARRASAEGQEGMKAFLEKRPASWNGVRPR
jgi:methylglutaconyl-CoA hydratase